MKLSELVGFIEKPEDFDILVGGHKVEYLNDACRIDDDSRFFVAGHEFGATHLIHVESHREGYEAAWGLWIDESPTIPEDELTEAYGVDGESFDDLARAELESPKGCGGAGVAWDEYHAKVKARAKELLSLAGDKARDEDGEYPELIEGYENQDNASGTGIVDVGHYSWMNEADLDDVEIIRREK